jgi:hypothetical protein
MHPVSRGLSFTSLYRRFATIGLAVAAFFCVATQAHAVTCTTESQMTNAERAEYVRALRALEAPMQAGNTEGVKALTIAPVAASFEGIAQSIQTLSPQIQGATFTVNVMYRLDSTDLKTTEEETQFFCSVGGSSMVVTVTIPQLPPGVYLLALSHATGVEHPQQVSLILQKELPPGASAAGASAASAAAKTTPASAETPASWKLAGFFVRPMSLGGKEGTWYWSEARQYAQKKQPWTAYFYYQTAAFLLIPVDFLSSPNLEKLQKEMQGVRPADLPGAEPMKLAAGGKTFEITNLRTDAFSGELDLVVNYNSKDTSDPVATRAEIVELMKALIAAHPEIRQAFHGIWVYAQAQGQRTFAIELPMAQIS